MRSSAGLLRSRRFLFFFSLFGSFPLVSMTRDLTGLGIAAGSRRALVRLAVERLRYFKDMRR